MRDRQLLIADLLYRFGFSGRINPLSMLKRMRHVLQQVDQNEEFFMLDGGDCITLCVLESYNHLEVVNTNCYRLTRLGKTTLAELETLDL